MSSADYNEYLGIREDLNFRIKDIVEEAGTGFAFPSRTTYMASDKAPSAERAATVATEVEAWRAAQKLPFPEFESEERTRMTDTLAFPPEGSPHHRPATAPHSAPEAPAGGRWHRQTGGRRGNKPAGSP